MVPFASVVLGCHFSTMVSILEHKRSLISVVRILSIVAPSSSLPKFLLHLVDALVLFCGEFLLVMFHIIFIQPQAHSFAKRNNSKNNQRFSNLSAVTVINRQQCDSFSFHNCHHMTTTKFKCH